MPSDPPPREELQQCHEGRTPTTDNPDPGGPQQPLLRDAVADGQSTTHRGPPGTRPHAHGLDTGGLGTHTGRELEHPPPRPLGSTETNTQPDAPVPRLDIAARWGYDLIHTIVA
eukprot:7363416-Prorocentrum_lima.AAC.1